MVVDIFLILVIFLSLYFLIRVLVSKLPILSKINVAGVKGEKEKKVKSKILEKRFLENFKNKILAIIPKGSFSNCSRKIKEKILSIEKKYSKKYNEIIKKEPTTVEKKIEKATQDGKKYFTEDNFQEAEKKFIEVISFDPRNIIAFKNLFKIYLAQKKNRQAKEIAEYILKLNQQALKWWLKFKKEGEAVPDKIANELLSCLINLGLVFQNDGDDQNAAKYFKEALEYRSNNPRLLDLLIENSIILKRKDEAVVYLEKIREVNPENQKISEWEEKINNIIISSSV